MPRLVSIRMLVSRIIYCARGLLVAGRTHDAPTKYPRAQPVGYARASVVATKCGQKAGTRGPARDPGDGTQLAQDLPMEERKAKHIASAPPLTVSRPRPALEESNDGTLVTDYAGSLGASEVQLQRLDAALLQFRRQAAAEPPPDIHATASRGTQDGSPLPHGDRIQASFGRHDVSGIGATVGGPATVACEELGAEAYASGNKVAFRGAPTLHTAAHEAAHVIQQRSGAVQLKGGVGQAGDRYEAHADAVADKVVAGESAEALLDGMAGSSTGGSTAVQRIVQFDELGTSYEEGGSTSGRDQDADADAERAGGVHRMGNALKLYNFDKGSAQLKPAHREALSDLRNELRGLYGPPQDDRWWRHVTAVEGGTSPEGPDKLNQSLSLDRAREAVSQFHIDAALSQDGAGHLDAATKGVGETQSQASTEQEWSLHRRVDVYVTHKPEEERDAVEKEKPGGGPPPPQYEGAEATEDPAGKMDEPDSDYFKWAETAVKGGIGVGNALVGGAIFGGLTLVSQALFVYAALKALAEAHEAEDRYAAALGGAYGIVCGATQVPLPGCPKDLGEGSAAFGAAAQKSLSTATSELQTHWAVVRKSKDPKNECPKSFEIVGSYYCIYKEPEKSLNVIYQSVVAATLGSASGVLKGLAEGRHLRWPKPSNYKSIGTAMAEQRDTLK